MKTLLVALLLALALPGCSHYSESARAERAYYKHLKKTKAENEKRKKRMVEHQRAEVPSLRTPPPAPFQENVAPQPDGQ